MNWLILTEIAYILLIALVVLRALYDTRSTTKALAYILFIIFVPVVGILFYFSFGINYRSGLSESIFAFANKDRLDNWGWSLAFGIITLIVGILLLLKPTLSITALVFYVGFVILFGCSWDLSPRNEL